MKTGDREWRTRHGKAVRVVGRAGVGGAVRVSQFSMRGWLLRRIVAKPGPHPFDVIGRRLGVTSAGAQYLVREAVLHFIRSWNRLCPREPLPIPLRQPCTCGKDPTARGPHRRGCALRAGADRMREASR